MFAGWQRCCRVQMPVERQGRFRAWSLATIGDRVHRRGTLMAHLPRHVSLWLPTPLMWPNQIRKSLEGAEAVVVAADGPGVVAVREAQAAVRVEAVVVLPEVHLGEAPEERAGLRVGALGEREARRAAIRGALAAAGEEQPIRRTI